MSERGTSSGPGHDRPPGGPPTGRDPCGIGQALAGVTDEPWQTFFSQWCEATELGPVAAQHVRDVAAHLARPASVLDEGDELLTTAWAAVRDAMDRAGAAPATAPRLEATA